jgi:hypothetical protein
MFQGDPQHRNIKITKNETRPRRNIFIMRSPQPIFNQFSSQPRKIEETNTPKPAQAALCSFGREIRDWGPEDVTVNSDTMDSQHPEGSK